MSDERVITALTPDSAEPPRIRVKSGRTVVAVIEADAMKSLDLRVGTPLTEPLLEALETAAAEVKARRDALRLLSFRARSSTELSRRLRLKGYDRDLAVRVCDRLQQSGLVDDEAFARDAAAGEVARKPAGARLLEAKLRAKGVSQPMARAAAAEALADRDLLADALSLARRRAASMQRLDDQTRRRRLHGALARRGFDLDVCRKAVDLALADQP